MTNIRRSESDYGASLKGNPYVKDSPFKEWVICILHCLFLAFVRSHVALDFVDDDRGDRHNWRRNKHTCDAGYLVADQQSDKYDQGVCADGFADDARGEQVVFSLL